jgi:hypothetical protein
MTVSKARSVGNIRGFAALVNFEPGSQRQKAPFLYPNCIIGKLINICVGIHTSVKNEKIHWPV